jgi:hypothetical protein
MTDYSQLLSLHAGLHFAQEFAHFSIDTWSSVS